MVDRIAKIIAGAHEPTARDRLTARLVIHAMREPTAPMLDIAILNSDKGPAPHWDGDGIACCGIGGADFVEVYRQMIDVAGSSHFLTKAA